LRENWTITSTDVTSDLPLVSVIVLNYNGKDVLEECIKSILNSNYPRVEVIVIDNGSADESYMIAKKYEPQVKLIKSPHNLGYLFVDRSKLSLPAHKYSPDGLWRHCLLEIHIFLLQHVCPNYFQHYILRIVFRNT